MPTKKRKEREKLQAEEQNRLDLLFSNAPAHGKRDYMGGDVTDALLAGIDETKKDHPRLNLKGALLSQTDDGCIVYRDDLMRDGARKTNAGISDDRRDLVRDLQKRYSDIWGKRGAPKIIAIEQGLKVRFIQKLFKEVPK